MASPDTKTQVVDVTKDQPAGHSGPSTQAALKTLLNCSFITENAEALCLLCEPRRRHGGRPAFCN